METKNKPRISVHIIAKETTNYGRMIFEASLRSLLIGNSGYADQIILVDDGCSDDVVQMFVSLFPSCGFNEGNLKIVVSNGAYPSFAEKRNVCLEYTHKDSDFIHWIDTDDIYHTGILNNFKDNFLSVPEKVKDLSKGICYFYHAMGCPWLIEEYYPKDNFFRYNSNLRWGKSVHERLENLSPGSEMLIPLFYYHVGYTRSVISTSCKWIHYSMLEDGKPDLYLRSDQPMYTMGIDRIIDDRLGSCKRMKRDDRIIPDAFMSILFEFGKLYGDSHSMSVEAAYASWQRWLNKHVDPQIGEYQRQWVDQSFKDKNWGACIRDIAEKKLWEKF